MVVLNRLQIRRNFLSYVFATLFMVPAASAEPIHLVTESYPLYNYLEDGELKGISVELLHSIMKDAGLEYDMELMPWARAIALAKNQNNYCVFTTVHTKERDLDFQWVEPLVISYSYLVKNEGSDVQAKTLEDARGLLVGTQLGDYTVDILKKLQFTRIDLASDIDVTINKLRLGRIELMPMAGSLINELAQKNIIVKPLLILTKSLNSVACNNEIPAETILRMQSSLNKLTDDGTLLAIFKKYGLDQNVLLEETVR